MRKDINRTKLSVALIAALPLLTIGCGGKSRSYDDNTAEIQGTVAKGIVKNALVTFFGVETDGSRLTSALTTVPSIVTTDTSGDYSAVIEDYTGPVFVEATISGSDTSMVCDIPDGCGTSAFGDDVSLTGTSFELSAVVPDIDDTATTAVNLSSITHMAATFAQEQTVTSVTTLTEAIQEAEDRVSVLLFGQTGVDLVELPPVDLTDATSISTVTGDDADIALRAAVLSAAILGSTIENGDSFADSFSVIDTLVDQGGIAETGSTTTIDLEDIFAESREVIDSVQTVLTDDGITTGTLVDLIDDLETDVIDDENDASNGSSDIIDLVPDGSDIEDPTGASGGSGV